MIIVVCIVVLFSLLITCLLISNTIKDTIHRTTKEKAEVIGKTIAGSEVVQKSLAEDSDDRKIQEYTSKIQNNGHEFYCCDGYEWH